jgi:HEAT repeat protein
MEEDGHPMARQAAVIALGLLGDRRATPRLIEALRHGPPDVRFQAAASLVQIDPESAARPLRRALGDEDPEVRASAVTALGVLGERANAGAIAFLLQDPSPAVELEAAVALARLGDPRGAPALVHHLDSKDHQILAAEHLYRCPSPDVTPALRRHLGRWLAPPLMKVWLSAALARLGEAQGRQRLIALLESRRQTVRGLTIQLLGEIGEGWAREALEAFAASPAGEGWGEEIAAALGG